ncbi:MAG: hypothetical protein U9R01_00585 [candidate division WOR-3 bacterium]|nr:hypothetical protein [candidate division WOR-3 bacterium]
MVGFVDGWREGISFLVVLEGLRMEIEQQKRREAHLNAMFLHRGASVAATEGTKEAKKTLEDTENIIEAIGKEDWDRAKLITDTIRNRYYSFRF